MMKRLYAPLYVLGTLISQIIGTFILALSLLPSYFLVYATWEYVSNWSNSFWKGLLLCLSLGFAFFISGNMLLLVIVLFRNLFRVKNIEKIGDFRTDRAILRFAFYSFLVNLAQNLFLPFVRGTPIILWFYRGMGAKIGKGTLITTTRIFDCDLIEIGKNCVIGGGVAIAAHTGEKRRGVQKKVVIGDRVTIGADTYVMPGVVIEDNVIVGANSMIPKDALLSANSVYAGAPVRKIDKQP